MTTATVYQFSARKPATAKPELPELTPFPDWAFNHPIAPNYASGCASGKAAALAFLKYLQGHHFSGGSLQGVVLDFMSQLQNAKSEAEETAIRGKIVGMFVDLEPWLSFAVRSATTDEMNNATEQSIRVTLQDAADSGPQSRYDAQQKAVRSERARQAANVRWDKKKALAATTTTIHLVAVARPLGEIQ